MEVWERGSRNLQSWVTLTAVRTKTQHFGVLLSKLTDIVRHVTLRKAHFSRENNKKEGKLD